MDVYGHNYDPDTQELEYDDVVLTLEEWWEQAETVAKRMTPDTYVYTRDLILALVNKYQYGTPVPDYYRNHACEDYGGYEYALNIDKGPHDVTRAAAIRDGLAFEYAVDVDKVARWDTYNATKDRQMTKWYEDHLGTPK